MDLISFSMRIYRVGKVSVVAACVAVLLSSPAGAQFSGSKRASDAVTVEQARGARHGDRVVLKGSLTKEVRRAQYMFKDKTGEVRVRIQRELWRGREITAKTLLRIRGKIQSDVRGRFVNVDYVQVLN